ncbi:hypothetical protein [Mesorhizobium sp. 10J20-29]
MIWTPLIFTERTENPMSTNHAVKYFDIDVIERLRLTAQEEFVTFYRRTELVTGRKRQITEGDIRELIVLAGAFATVATLPPQVWIRYSRLVSSLRQGHYEKKNFGRFSSGARAVLGAISPSDVETIFRTYRDHSIRRRIGMAREFIPYRKAPVFQVYGADALREAAAAGQGVIVWSNPFVYHTLTGQALAAAGLSSCRVSASVHGYSVSEFGRTTFNKLAVWAENRYLRDRLVFERDQGKSVTRRIASKLESGAIISMTNNAFAGSVFIELPLGQTGVVSMATTPLSFAVKRRVPLFCASVIETEPFEAYEMHLVAIPPDVIAGNERAKSLKDYRAMAQMALHVRDCLAQHLKLWPEQYGQWNGLEHSVVTAATSVKPIDRQAKS